MKLFYKIWSYIRNRWFIKTHLVHVKYVPRGAWVDRCDIAFHAPFQVMVDFIEKELYIECLSAFKRDLKTEPEIVAEKYRLKQLSPAEIMYYELRKDTPLVRAAFIEDAFKFHGEYNPRWLELKKIYEWYRYERPARKELELECSDNDVQFVHLDGVGDDAVFTVKFSPKYAEYLDKLNEQDAEWKKEDQEMAKKLVDCYDLFWI